MRNYLLDSRFQLKYSGFLVIVAVVISGVMGAVLYETTRAVVGESSALVEESKKVSEVSRMNIRDLASDSPELLTEFNREADAHDKALSEQQARLHSRPAADDRVPRRGARADGRLDRPAGYLLHPQGGGTRSSR